MTSVRVGFTAKDNGFHFANRFPSRPIRQFRLGSVATLDVGDVANGLCGGMSYTTRDIFEHHLSPPPDAAAPRHGPHSTTISCSARSTASTAVSSRLASSASMSPVRPDREPWWAQVLGMVRFDRHSRAWVMIHEEWPAIKQDLDQGRLVTLGLIRAISLDPNQLGHNHQVLAYGYDLDGSQLTLRICDPNWPGDDGVTLSLDISDPRSGGVPRLVAARSADVLLLSRAVHRPRSERDLLRHGTLPLLYVHGAGPQPPAATLKKQLDAILFGQDAATTRARLLRRCPVGQDVRRAWRSRLRRRPIEQGCTAASDPVHRNPRKDPNGGRRRDHRSDPRAGTKALARGSADARRCRGCARCPTTARDVEAARRLVERLYRQADVVASRSSVPRTRRGSRDHLPRSDLPDRRRQVRE